ncbi:alpha/beta hydrolase [Streptomyces sp. MAI_2237]
MRSGGAPSGSASEARRTGPPRRRRRRGRRTVLAALVAAAVVLPLTGATRPDIPAPPPASLAPLTPETLDAAYAANRADAAEASRMAAAHGDTTRAAADHAMASPSRRLLAFDGRGEGRATEVFGDLTHASRVAVLVPGSDTSLDTWGRFRATAVALRQRLLREAPHGTGTAVVAWLGYTTPATVSTTVLTTARAEEAAPRLRDLLAQLHGLARPDAHVSLLCHSYGTVVCGRSAARLSGLGVSDIVLVGSPGTGVDSAADLRTRARVWAARGDDDWIADVPHLRTDFFGTTVGFGTDPVSPAFGARVFAAGGGGHSDYFRPGSASLANLARIVLGETREVSHA